MVSHHREFKAAKNFGIPFIQDGLRALPIVLSLLPVTTFGRYTGPVPNYAFEPTAPARDASFCLKQNYTTELEKKACTHARIDGQRMAELFGLELGKVEGFLTGMSWGMHQGHLTTRSDRGAFMQGARIMELSVNPYSNAFRNGLEQVASLAESIGTEQGSADAREKWNQSVNSGKRPSAAYSLPSTPFQTLFRNPFVELAGAPHSPREILRHVLELKAASLPVFQNWNRTSYGEISMREIWDLWFDHGRYTFDQRPWLNEDLALRVWMERTRGNRDEVDALLQQNSALAHLYRSLFKQNYLQHVNFHFTRGFDSQLEIGERHGFGIGAQVGSRLSFEQGVMVAFNEKFEHRSRITFERTFQQGFGVGFSETFELYRSRPQLSVSLLAVEGEVDDGILQPGESITLRYQVVNAGGVGSSLTSTVLGQVTHAHTEFQSIEAISSRVFQFKQAARISSQMKPNQIAEVVLDVNGLKDSLRTELKRQLAVGSPSVLTDLIEGRATIQVNLTNVSTRTTPASAVGKLWVDGEEIETLDIGKIDAGESKALRFTVHSIDPVRILNGDLWFSTQVMVGSTAMDDRVSAPARIEDKLQGVLQLFNAHVNGKGFTSIEMKDRIAELRHYIVLANRKEVRTRNDFNRWEFDFNQTVLGKLLTAIKSSSQSDAAKEAHFALIKKLSEEKNQFFSGIFGLKSKMKASYLRGIQELKQALSI